MVALNSALEKSNFTFTIGFSRKYARGEGLNTNTKRGNPLDVPTLNFVFTPGYLRIKRWTPGYS